VTDILFKTKDYLFSYRVSGILVRDGKVLLQKPTNDGSYAFPGDHVVLGETNAETLIREWKEEIGVDIIVTDLKWVEENIFPSWQGDGRICHQICLNYAVRLMDESQIQPSGCFLSKEVDLAQDRGYEINFCWVPIEDVYNLEVYPAKAAELLARMDEGVAHIVYREE